MFLVFSSDGLDLEASCLPLLSRYIPEFSCTGKFPSFKAYMPFCLDESSIKVMLVVDGQKRG